MSDYMVWIYFLIFVVLILLEMPIGTAMLLSSLLYVIQNGQSFVMFAQKTATSFVTEYLVWPRKQSDIFQVVWATQMFSQV